MKLNSLFTGRIGWFKGQNFGSQPTRDEFCHKKKHFVTIEIFYMLLATLWALCIKKFLRTGRSGKCRNLRSNTKLIFFVMIDFFHGNKIVSNQSFLHKLSPNCRILYEKYHVSWMKYHMKCGINAVCIFMYRLQARQFSFSEICWQNRHLENSYHWITISFKKAVIQNTSEHLFREKNQ